MNWDGGATSRRAARGRFRLRDHARFYWTPPSRRRANTGGGDGDRPLPHGRDLVGMLDAPTRTLAIDFRLPAWSAP